MDPLLLITVLLSLLLIGGILVGAQIIALIAKVSGQLDALIAAYQASINPADAATIQSGVQSLSDKATAAGFPPAP